MAQVNTVNGIVIDILRKVRAGVCCALKKSNKNAKNNENLVQAIFNIIIDKVPSGIKPPTEEEKKEIINKTDPEILVQAISNIITGTVPTTQEKKEIINKTEPEILAEAIINIIRSATNCRTVLKEEIREELKKKVDASSSPECSIASLIFSIIKNGVNKGQLAPEIAEETLKKVGKPKPNVGGTSSNLSNFILSLIVGSLSVNKQKKFKETIPPPPPKPNTAKYSNLVYKVIMNVFKIKLLLKGKMASTGAPPPGGGAGNGAGGVGGGAGGATAPPVQPGVNLYNGHYNLTKNFLESRKKNQFNIAIPGFVFTTRNGKTGYYRNMGAQPQGVEGPPQPPKPRNYSGKTLKELFNARNKFPNNRERINKYIKSQLETAMSNLKYASGSALFRRAAELLKILPENYPGRSRIVELVIDEIRRISRRTNIDYARRNLGNVRNRRIRDELNRRARNLRERRRNNETENEYERRRRRERQGRYEEPPRRRAGESDREFRRREAEYNQRKEEAHMNELARRRAARAALAPPRLPPLAPPVGNAGRYGGNMGGAPPPGGNMGGAPPPPLPPAQQQAIANAGGVQRAVSTIAAVPGGAPEVAKAAEALNETGGNTTVAVTVKGASPQAIKAVQNLGGVKNTVNILDGLNTLSQTPATRRRKAAAKRRTARRTKKTPIRLTELNRVIEAVKKQKLISLMAHNITRTNNIHPNDEKRKKYYKKVMKAYLLKRPFANVVKRAAKKNV